MKRWLLAGLLGLAILLFLAPGIIGMLAERSLEQQLAQNSRMSPEYVVRELDFERGWFNSAGRHRVPLADPALAQFIALLTPGAGYPLQAPALIIETRLEHGLVALGNAPHDASALIPALANGVSTLSLELPDGSELPVPGVLYSRLGLTGSATFRYELPAGDQTRDKLHLTWQDSSAGLSSTSTGRELSFTADLGATRASNEFNSLEFSSAQVAASRKATPFGFPLGDVKLRIADVDWLTFGIPERWALLDVEGHSAFQGTKVQGDLQFKLLALQTEDGPYDIEIRANVANANAERLGPIIRALQYSRNGASLASLQPYTGFDDDLRGLISAGINLDIEQLQLRTSAGDGIAKLTITVPELRDVASWPALLLALTATADIEIGRTRVEAPSPITDQLRLLIAGGFLILDGDVYRLKADYAKGKATVNGAPLVIPMDLLRQ